MIVSDRWQFLIVTPTKTGNHSLRGMAEAWATRHGDPAELRYYRPVKANRAVGFQHQVAVPVGMEHYDRWLMVRDPYARLVSCFEFMRHLRTEWGHWNTVAGFEPFCEWFARQRAAIEAAGFPEARVIGASSPYKFIDAYVVLHGLLAGDIPQAARRWGQRPAGRIRLERIGDDLASVERVALARWTQEHGEPPPRPWTFPAVPHRNAAKPGDRWPGMTTWRDYWTGSDRLTELGEQLCGEDARWLARNSRAIPEPGLTTSPG